jgi:6-phosphofructokinase 1
MEDSLEPLDVNRVSGILRRGGTILATSRTNPYKRSGDVERLKDNVDTLGLDAIVAIGGEDTLGVAARLVQEGLKLVGIPKTIDNDVWGTDYTIGFDTAVSIATEAIDRLHTTAESHERVMVVEVMGRHAGWIALYAGIAGGADVILVPELPFDINKICKTIKKRHLRGKNFSIVVIAEGAQFAPGMVPDGGLVLQDQSTDAFGHVRLGGIGALLAKEIERITGCEARVSVLGHLQRCGSPTAGDRVLATRFGIKAADLVNDKAFGNMAALQGNQVISVPLSEVGGKIRLIDLSLYDIAQVFFG